MKRLYLDQEELDWSENLAEKIEERLKDTNRVVRKITMNGVEMVNATLEEVLKEYAGKGDVLIETCSTREMLAEAISDAGEYIPVLIEKLPLLRDKVSGGDMKEAGYILEAGMEGLEWVILTLQAYGSYMEDEEKKERIELELERVFAVFAELEEALRDGDMILICDILEYEIVPFLEAILPVVVEG